MMLLKPKYFFCFFLAALIFLFIPSTFADSSQPSQVIPPADFKITAIAGGVAPGDSESKIEIDAKGHAIYYTMSSREKGEFIKVNEFTIDRLSLKTIYGAVAKSDFFNLREQYIEKGTLGGSFAEITVTLHGKMHTVHTQNIEMLLFDDIIIAINLATPDDNKILYNAIL
jgi:hypothetical protein